MNQHLYYIIMLNTHFFFRPQESLVFNRASQYSKYSCQAEWSVFRFWKTGSNNKNWKKLNIRVINHVWIFWTNFIVVYRRRWCFIGHFSFIFGMKSYNKFNSNSISLKWKSGSISCGFTGPEMHVKKAFKLLFDQRVSIGWIA